MNGMHAVAATARDAAAPVGPGAGLTAARIAGVCRGRRDGWSTAANRSPGAAGTARNDAPARHLAAALTPAPVRAVRIAGVSTDRQVGAA